MKKLLVLLLILSPAFLYAQTTGLDAGRLINRVDREEGTAISIHHSSKSTFNCTLNITPQSTQTKAPSFTLVLSDSVITGDEGGAPELSGVVTNTTKVPINVIYERTHIRIDTNLSSGICLCNCFADFLDTLPMSAACSLSTGTPNWTFLYHPHTVFGQSISQPDTIIDYIKLTALTGDPSDTIGFIVSGILMPTAGVNDAGTQTSVKPHITSIYPSPLVQGSSIKVKVTSPRESSLSYTIYDAVGRVVALGVTRQHIGLGDNTIGIGSLDGLVNGSYMLKFNFGDGSSDTHFFQILK